MKPDQTLPVKATKPLIKTEKTENRDYILRWLESGGEDITLLSDLQRKLYDRWVFADELIRRNFGKKKREEIAEFIMAKWGVSRAIAYQDIVNAEYIFSSSTPLNKKYKIQVLIEFFEKLAREASLKDDYKSAAAIGKVLTGLIEAYPEYVPERSPKNTIYVIKGNLMQVNLTPEEAMQEADTIIKEMEGDDIRR